jgi:choice-of-anchor A domain-containing protein
MKFIRLAGTVGLLAMLGSGALRACPGTPFNINDLLRWASPLNWSLLALGGPTKVALNGGSSIGMGVRGSVVGIAGQGSLTLDGPSFIQARVEHQPDVTVNRSIASYIANVHQEDGSDGTMVNKALTDALSAAHCMAVLSPTIADAPPSINIADPSGNITIHADDQLNVVNLTDLVLTNGVLTLTSNQPPCSDRGMAPADPNCAFPTVIVNVTGKFTVGGGSKIVLAGGLDEVHVIYNVIGTGDVQFLGDADSGIPNSEITGVLFAPYRSVDLGSGRVNGSVIAGGPMISLSSGQIVGHFNVDQ